MREAAERGTSDPVGGLEWGEAIWRNPETGREERVVTLGGGFLMTCPEHRPPPPGYLV